MAAAGRKRSVTIAGHRTSFSLEEPFWRELKTWAAEEGISLNGLVARLDAARVAGAEEINLSSALRVAVLERLREKLGRA
jgi:predicted DNA-binding ribbon-helix-helix protein